MSPSLPVMSGQQVINALALVGFVRVSQKGSHVKLRNSDGRVVIVPNHKELAVGTLRSIIRQADMTPSEFRKLTDQ